MLVPPPRLLVDDPVDVVVELDEELDELPPHAVIANALSSATSGSRTAVRSLCLPCLNFISLVPFTVRAWRWPTDQPLPNSWPTTELALLLEPLLVLELLVLELPLAPESVIAVAEIAPLLPAEPLITIESPG